MANLQLALDPVPFFTGFASFYSTLPNRASSKSPSSGNPMLRDPILTKNGHLQKNILAKT